MIGELTMHDELFGLFSRVTCQPPAHQYYDHLIVINHALTAISLFFASPPGSAFVAEFLKMIADWNRRLMK
jgi:hypothetical protein